MIKIKATTTTESIRAAQFHKPRSADFMYRNAGNTMMYINDIPVAPGDVFGKSNEVFYATLIAAGKTVTMFEATEFKIGFSDTVAPGFEQAYLGPSQPNPVQLCTVITTEFHLLN